MNFKREEVHRIREINRTLATAAEAVKYSFSRGWIVPFITLLNARAPYLVISYK